VSVAVDGIYKQNEAGDKVYEPRSQEELNQLTELVKNTVGFKPLQEDEVYVTCMRFDRGFFEQEKNEMAKMARNELFQYWGKVGLITIIVLFGFFFLRSLARNIAGAMNPPLPKYAGVSLDSEEEEMPESMRRQNEILDRVENIARENPASVAALLKGWLNETDKAG
jgi:flagellar M-ring protein FliF